METSKCDIQGTTYQVENAQVVLKVVKEDDDRPSIVLKIIGQKQKGLAIVTSRRSKIHWYLL